MPAGCPEPRGWRLGWFRVGLGGSTTSGTIAPVAVTAPAPVLAETVERPVPALAPEPDVLAIADLCYRGRAALHRAVEVRREIREAMASHAPGAVLRPMVEELLDLVDLATVE